MGYFHLLIIILLMGTAVIVFGYAIVQIFLSIVIVKNTSMEPTFEPGDRVLVWRLWSAKWLRKNQIVLVWPGNTYSSVNSEIKSPLYIKRVVGLPGDTIVTHIRGGANYENRNRPLSLQDEGNRTWYIPANHIFVKSDSKNGGDDSITWGPIPAQNLLGIAIMKLPWKTKNMQA